LPKTQNFEIVETNIKETTQDNGKLYKVTSKLTIKKLDVKHGGSYACRSGNQQHSERLDVYGPPTPREVLKVETKEGYALTLQCPMGGYPLKDATWKDSNGNSIQSVLGELKFENTEKKHTGIYTCNMKNDFGNATAKINLNVVPDILQANFKGMTDVVINVAGACSVCGKPANETKEKCSGFLNLQNIKIGYRHGRKFPTTYRQIIRASKDRKRGIKVYTVRKNRRRNNLETSYVNYVSGTCCWKVHGRDKQRQIFKPSMSKEPKSAYFQKIYAGDCNDKSFKD